MKRFGLGEVWIPGQDSETGYTGEDGNSVFSIQYARNKAREFQTTLNAVDEASNALAASIAIVGDEDLDALAELNALQDEYQSKKTQFRLTAEAINLAAAGINSLGGRFPELSIPAGLAAPIVIPLALVAAIGTAAGLIVWGNTWLDGVSERLKIVAYGIEQRALIEMEADPVKRSEMIAKTVAMNQEIQRVEAATASSKNSALSDVANIVKWLAIGGAAFLVYQAFMSTRRE